MGTEANIFTEEIRDATEEDSLQETMDSSTEEENTIVFGLANTLKKENITYLVYSGEEELELDVTMRVEENMILNPASTVEFGIQIWVDGQPQLFRVNEEDYQYIYTYTAEMGKQKIIPCYFTPTVGEAGDFLEVTVSWFWYPSWQPESMEVKSYTYRLSEFTTVRAWIDFQQTPKNQKLDENLYTILLQSSTDTKELTLEKLEEYFSIWGIGDEQRSTAFDNIRYILYVDDKNDTYSSDENLGDRETITVRLELFGPDNLPVRCDLYLNHQPLGCEWSQKQTNSLSGDEATILEAELDVSQIEDMYELYAVIIPINSHDRNEFVWPVKTTSICLYR